MVSCFTKDTTLEGDGFRFFGMASAALMKGGA